jgi:hypothetical protein
MQPLVTASLGAPGDPPQGVSGITFKKANLKITRATIENDIGGIDGSPSDLLQTTPGPGGRWGSPEDAGKNEAGGGKEDDGRTHSDESG